MLRQFASGSVRLLAIAVGALLALGAGTAPRLSLTVDGHAAGSVAFFVTGGITYVEFAPAARAADVRVSARGSSRTVAVGGNIYLIRADDRLVTENGAVALRLASAPAIRTGRMFLAIDDLSDVLGIGMELRGGTLDISPSLSETTKIVEIPAPAPPPAPPVAATTLQPAGALRRYGTLNVTVASAAGIQTHSVAAAIDGDTVRANAFFDGAGMQSSLSGGLAIFGTNDHNVAVGGVGDPLSGVVFRSGVAYGGVLVNAAGHARYADAVRQNGGTVIAASRIVDGHSDALAFVHTSDGRAAPMLGVRDLREWPAGEFTREAWLGSNGVAGGVSLRTRGKTFVETDLDFAGAGLPLKPGDAPMRVDVGDHLTPGLELRSGIFGGRSSTAGAFFAASGRLRHGTASAEWQTGQTSLSFNVNGATTSGFLAYYRYAGNSQLYGQAEAQRGAGTYELHTQLAGNAFSDSYVQWSSRRGAIGPLAGVELLRSGTVARGGPIAGFRYAFGPATDVQLAMHPLVAGYGVRVAISQRIPLPERHPLGATNVTMTGGIATSLPVHVAIDGVAVCSQRVGSFALQIPPGAHYLSAITTDGTFGSAQVLVRGGAGAVSLALWPVRSIVGKVAIDAPPGIASSFTLEGAAIELTPSGLVALVGADGTFSFEATPVDPDAKLQVIPSSLAAGLKPGAALAVPAGGPVEIFVVPSEKVEKKAFPGG